MHWGNSALATLIAVTVTLTASAAEKADRPDVGDAVPSYASVKCGGIDDGVSVGKATCYTCRSGPEPIFYVFAKKQSKSLAQLAGRIDEIVNDKRDQKQKVSGVVNFLGDPEDEQARKKIGRFAKQYGLKNIAVTITGDGAKFDIDDGDEITVILFEKGVIRLRTSVKRGGLNEKSVASIIERSKALIK